MGAEYGTVERAGGSAAGWHRWVPGNGPYRVVEMRAEWRQVIEERLKWAHVEETLDLFVVPA